MADPLQKRKTDLLKLGPKQGRARKDYSSKTRVDKPSPIELAAFESLQKALSKETSLTHHNPKRTLYIDLDASKSYGFGAMLYHVKDLKNKATNSPRVDNPEDSENKAKESGLRWKKPPQSSVQPILYLSRMLTVAETHYWPTELEVACLVWVLKKVRHMVDSTELPTIVHTDHSATIGIAKQTTLSTTSTDKLNLRLIRAADYIQRFNLDLRHIAGKTNIVPDALSRLTVNPPFSTKPNGEEGELDMLTAYNYETVFVEMRQDLREELVKAYTTDKQLGKIMDKLEKNERMEENAPQLPYRRHDGLLLHVDNETGLERPCVPPKCVKAIFDAAHLPQHQGFATIYKKIANGWYIRNLSGLLREYLKHCPECSLLQTHRHAPYGTLQPIQSPDTPFHTITIDFILALPTSRNGEDTIMSVTDKFSKRVTFIPGVETWTAEDWAKSLLQHLQLLDWGLPRVIISDRDRKFTSDMWKALFKLLKIRLLYSTAYHPQTDGMSERTNQTTEIALRFYLNTLENLADWPAVLPRLQHTLNNSQHDSWIAIENLPNAMDAVTDYEAQQTTTPVGGRRKRGVRNR